MVSIASAVSSSSLHNLEKNHQAAATEPMVAVIHSCEKQAKNLKSQIEFMDSPPVMLVSPENWKQDLAGTRLAAVFIESDLPDQNESEFMAYLLASDPNVPIVLIEREAKR